MNESTTNQKDYKKIKISYQQPEKHWVGDGFYVHGILRPHPELTPYISPFILMDYASPKEFLPSDKPKGVGEHPHRGFETVTFSYQGEVEHRDSSGGGGVIKPGDVQWMTAGSGVVHDEFHSTEFTQKGGVFEMVQLWVNLPKKHKMTKPKYQGIKAKDIPLVKIGEHSSLKVVAGECQGAKGPASTFTRINLFNIVSQKSDKFTIELDPMTSTILLIMEGTATLEDELFSDKSILIFEKEGNKIFLETSDNFKGLLLNGEPIDEPMVAHGPFVMNTREEISEAIRDYQAGKMGNL